MRERKGFICDIAWDMEIGHTDVTVYESAAALEEEHGKGCGVVEIRMREHKRQPAKRRGRRYTPAQLQKKLLHDARVELRKTQAYIAKLERDGYSSNHKEPK